MKEEIKNGSVNRQHAVRDNSGMTKQYTRDYFSIIQVKLQTEVLPKIAWLMQHVEGNAIHLYL